MRKIKLNEKKCKHYFKTKTLRLGRVSVIGDFLIYEHVEKYAMHAPAAPVITAVAI